MRKCFYRLKAEIDSLTVFSDIKNDPAIAGLHKLLEAMADRDTDLSIKRYSQFVSELYQTTACLTDYVKTLVLQDDNFYVKGKAAKKEMAKEMDEAVDNELSILEEIASLKSLHFKEDIDYEGFLPDWTNRSVDIRYDFMEKLNNITRTGYGIFAKYNFFRIENGQLIPVAHPDFQPLNELFGYERERELIIKNTAAFVEGKGASNMLLYGDAGTGKSSTIKAVAAAMAPKGLRLVEVKKTQLYQIPKVMEELSSNPLKFILFIDDLSFTGNDDNFSALKATLEGSISGCGDNVVIFATSNRRHLVKETFADRMGDELHLNDTMQETMSLSARFGLTITFQKPDKEEYLNIVKSLAKEYGVEMDEAELCRRAEAHAIRKNGRSPRTAKQFIELLKIGI